MASASEKRPELDDRTSRLLDEAIDLVIRRQNAPENFVTLQTISAWRGRSAEHGRVWQCVAEAHGLSGAALAEPAKPRLTRRNLVLAGTLGLGAGVLGAWGLPYMRLRLQADQLTATAELLPVELRDGTRITLGPASAIAMPDHGETRAVRLLRGMAWFDVAPDPTHPFVLELNGGVETRTAGASFEVSQDAGVVNLAVARDEVELIGTSRYGIGAGRWIRLDTETGHPETGSRDGAMAGAWRTGMVVAEAEPLETLVARIARWLPGRVIVADAAIGRARISGLFDISDPERALEAAVRPTGGRLRRVSGLLAVISSV
ncbi:MULTISPECIES: FecR family protein [Paracoccus]|uniref:FecR family protein n=1 Tax=Paracoccus versutus TaxID=34007 RepID=A0A3D9XGD3_PARVE|nr:MULTISPECIES: FecR domain-containing protein [Paracoccus]REF68618.1 FecR family protein [Paracoccus versutus]WGR56806.1 iron dicitrate transport regulator FecR [Paracoccus versutus]